MISKLLSLNCLVLDRYLVLGETWPCVLSCLGSAPETKTSVRRWMDG